MSTDGTITDGKELEGEAMPRIVETFRKAVIGKRVSNAGYMKYDTDDCFPFLELDNGKVFLLVQCDDEGNGPGVIQGFTSSNDSIGLCETRAKS